MTHPHQTDIVMALDFGEDESEVAIRYEVSIEKIDEIMAAHDYERCAACGHWYNKMEVLNEVCTDCRADMDDE